jgi:hypothetical protein
MTLAALSVLGWVVVILLIAAVVGTIVYWVKPKSSAAAQEDRDLTEMERRPEGHQRRPH